jgi:hypothetical protein
VLKLGLGYGLGSLNAELQLGDGAEQGALIVGLNAGVGLAVVRQQAQQLEVQGFGLWWREPEMNG